MTGWKTWTAVVMAAGYGVGGYFFGLHGADKAVELVIAALGMAGIGHKVEKIRL